MLSSPMAAQPWTMLPSLRTCPGAPLQHPSGLGGAAKGSRGGSSTPPPVVTPPFLPCQNPTHMDQDWAPGAHCGLPVHLWWHLNSLPYEPQVLDCIHDFTGEGGDQAGCPPVRVIGHGKGRLETPVERVRGESKKGRALQQQSRVTGRNTCLAHAMLS